MTRKLGGWYLTVLAAALITHDAFGFGLFLLAVAACVLFIRIKVIR